MQPPALTHNRGHLRQHHAWRVVGIRDPPGAPAVMNSLPSFKMIVGSIEDTGLLAG